MGLSFGRPGEETDGEVLAIYEKLFKRYPALDGIRASFMNAYLLLRDAYRRGNKLLVCGNGGSAADSGHIVGELMKGFMKKRGIGRLYNEESADLLQGALPAIDLTQHTALNTAVANDNSPDLMFAQQVLGYGAAGDVLLAISTSGNAENCRRAALTAKAKNLAVIALTGPDGGRLAEIADCAVKAPGDCTADIQEHHLPVYHTLCAMLEEKFF
jgi:D-sedoheptulose 7-phosphate isomerase